MNAVKKVQEGFTLVELMVVVAIIGVLSAVAIPNFKKYQAKSKTSEAKLQLSSIYSAETAFMADADSYATCLNDMGYNSSAEKDARYYTTGFLTEYTTAGATINGIACSVAGTDGQSHFLAGKKVANKTTAKTDLPASSVGLGGASFIAGATGYIDSTKAQGNVADKWTVNENKFFVHMVPAGY